MVSFSLQDIKFFVDNAVKLLLLSIMSSLKQVVKSLDLTSEHMWEITLDKTAFDILKRKCSRLSAQVAVHHALQNTVTHLLESDSSTPLPNAQARLTKFERPWCLVDAE